MGSPRRRLDSFSQKVDPTHPQFVSAVARAFTILRCFEQGDHYLGNQDIVRRTGLPKPTVSRLAFTLASLGYLSYSPTQEKYALGAGVLALGHAFMKGGGVISVARPLMEELAEYTQSAVMLGMADGLHVIVLEVCQGDPTFQIRVETGAQLPQGSTALGRAALAGQLLPVFEAQLAELERGCLPEEWPHLRAGVLAAREDYETVGYCSSLGDWHPDVFGIGVPMASADHSRVFAFNCSGRASILTRDKLMHDFGPKLVALRDAVYAATAGHF